MPVPGGGTDHPQHPPPGGGDIAFLRSVIIKNEEKEVK
jgi:hypothetical protein